MSAAVIALFPKARGPRHLRPQTLALLRLAAEQSQATPSGQTPDTPAPLPAKGRATPRATGTKR